MFPLVNHQQVLNEFSPAILSGCQCWFISNTGITLNGSTVSVWADQSGNGLNAIQASSAAQPTYTSNGDNGRPSLTWSGSANSIRMSTGNFPNGPLSAMTVFAVCNFTPVANYAFIFDGTTSGSRFTVFKDLSSGDIALFAGTQDNVQTMFSGLKCVIATNNAGSGALYYGETQQGSTLTVGSDTWTALNIGNQFGNAIGWNGNINEIAVFDRVLTTTEIQELAAYANLLYGTSL